MPLGVALVGDGWAKKSSATTRLLCMAPNSRLAFGYSGVGSGINYGGKPCGVRCVRRPSNRCRGTFALMATTWRHQPLFIGTTQSTWLPLQVLNGACVAAYNSGTAYTTGQRCFYQGIYLPSVDEHHRNRANRVVLGSSGCGWWLPCNNFYMAVRSRQRRAGGAKRTE